MFLNQRAQEQGSQRWAGSPAAVGLWWHGVSQSRGVQPGATAQLAEGRGGLVGVEAELVGALP